MILENCYECLRPVEDDEWVANWGSCHACFNKHLDKYDAQERSKVDRGEYSSQYPEGTYGSN